jgi:hypothetical protein
VKAILGPYDRRLEIDPALLARSHAVLESVLTVHRYLTRPELAAALEAAGIPATGQRLGHLVMHAELDGLICSGPRRGKQFTYALVEERAPAARRLDREEALAGLALRYFSGHGPAQVQDCAWWSGLTVGEVRRGVELAGTALAREEIGGKSYWSSPDAPSADVVPPIVHLLPNYDEYLVAYRDRGAALDPARTFGSILAHVVVLNGRVWGGWKRRLQAGKLVVETGPLDVMGPAETAALRRAADRLAEFLGLSVTLTQPLSG